MKSKPIGFIDWGIGGLGVYKEFRKQFKNHSVIYFSDSGFTPYGKTKKKQLIARVDKIIRFLKSQNISVVVIACNAASTVLDEVQKLNSDIKILGMLEAGKTSIIKSNKTKILVLGGNRTIESQYFQTEFEDSDLKALAAQPLSALIERGQQNSKEFNSIVASFKTKFEPEAVLLACTHYPAAEKVFKKHFPKAKILDPAFAVIDSLKKVVPKIKIRSHSIFYTTGSTTKSKQAAKLAFKIAIKKFQKVNLK